MVARQFKAVALLGFTQVQCTTLAAISTTAEMEQLISVMFKFSDCLQS